MIPEFPIPVNVKQYKAIMTQTSTNAPTVKVLINTFDAPIVWARDTVGQYYGTLANAFTKDKSWGTISLGSAYHDSPGDNSANYIYFDANQSQYVFITSEFNGSASDGQITEACIEINVFK